MGFLLFWNSGCILRGKPAATESRYPTYCACWMFKCFHNPPNSDMDYRIFNVCTDANVCDCTRGCTGTRKRVCTESWLWEKNLLPHRGIEPASAAWRSDALTNWANPLPSDRRHCPTVNSKSVCSLSDFVLRLAVVQQCLKVDREWGVGGLYLIAMPQLLTTAGRPVKAETFVWLCNAVCMQIMTSNAIWLWNQLSVTFVASYLGVVVLMRHNS